MVLLGTIFAQLAAGTAYSWAVLTVPLSQRLGVTYLTTNVTFSLMMIFLSVSTLSIGWLQAKVGVKWTIVGTGFLLGAGFFVGAFAHSIWILYLFTGVVVGIGDGIAYLLSLTNCLRWFPDKTGTIAGISVGSYGVPAIVLPMILNPVIHSGATISTVAGKQVIHYVQSATTHAMIIWAVTALILMIVGGLMLRDAPITTKVGVTPGQYTVKQLLRTPQSYLLTYGVAMVAFSGLYVIGNASAGAKIAVPSLTTGVFTIVSLIAVVNTCGRFFLGWLSDYVRRTTLVAMALTVLTVFAFVLGFSWHASSGGAAPWLFILSFVLFGFMFGGSITVCPTIAGEFYGKDNQSRNYSIIYQGFALGALITLLLNALQVPFSLSFPIGGVIIGIGAVIFYIIRWLPLSPPPEFRESDHPVRLKATSRFG
jgi:OFA family oxalate/formate antiporter-like MFS transporter